MIKVNLLPQDAAARKAAGPSGSSGSGGPAIAGILTIAFIGVFVYGYFVYSTYAASDKARIAAESKYNKLKKDIEAIEGKYQELKASRALYQNQLDVLNALDPPERLLWTEKWNLLPELVPEGIYLTRVLVTEDVREVETSDSVRAKAEWEKKGKKGPEPVTVKRPVITQTLQVEGISYVEGGESDKRLTAIINFLENIKDKKATIPFTKTQKSFMDRFTPDVTYAPITAENVGGREVSRFNFKIKSMPL